MQISVACGRQLPRRRVRGLLLLAVALTINELAACAAAEALQRDRDVDQFRPFDEVEVERAFRDVASALTNLEIALEGSPSVARGWKLYLDWETQQRRLAERDRDAVRFWRAVAARLARDAPGLELPAFLAYRERVQTLVRRLTAANLADPQHAYLEALQRLQRAAETPAGAWSEADRSRARAALDWFSECGQTHPAASQLLQQSAFANVLVRLRPEALLEGSVRQRDAEPVVGRLLGRPYVGNATTDLVASVKSAPSHGAAAIRFLVEGDYHVTTQSRDQGVVVSTTSHYDLFASAQGRLSLNGLQFDPVVLRGDYRSHIASIRTPHQRLRGRIERDEARQAFRESYGAARRETEAGLRSAVENALRERCVEFNKEYALRLLSPLKRLDLGPLRAEFDSDDAAVATRWTLARPQELAAPSQPHDTLQPTEDAVVWVHESALQNYLQRRQPQRTCALGTLLRIVGVETERSATDQEELSIEPAPSAAVECFFRDDGVVCILHANRLSYRGQKYLAADVRIVFQLSHDSGGWRLVRNDAPVVGPSTLDPTGRRLGVRDIAFRRVLTNVFDQEVPRSIALSEAFDGSAWGVPPNWRLLSIGVGGGWLRLSASRDGGGATAAQICLPSTPDTHSRERATLLTP